MGQLEGKTAVVTGGSTGIGLATAVRLASEGAHVFVTGRREAELDAAVEAIGSATGVVGDIAVEADLDRLYAAVRDRGRGLDVLFANAAVASLSTLTDTTTQEFDRVFGINVRGTMLTVQKSLPLLNDGASVILSGSTSADNGAEAFGAYAATKAAVRSFGRTWANELKGRGIRVNTISPGPTDTPGFDEMFGENAAAVKEQVGQAVPIGRMARTEEIAAVVTFLASSQSSYVTGANYYVDGGENQI